MITKESYKTIRNKTFAAVRKFMRGRRSFNNQDCQDLVSEIMLIIVTKWNTIKDKKKLSSWIAAITRNKIYDYLRRARSYESKYPLMPNTIDENKDFIDTCVGKNDTVESSIDTQYFVRRVKGALSEKDKKFLKVLLFKISGYNVEEISKITGLKINTVKTRIFRAKKALKSIPNIKGVLNDA